MWLSAGGHQSTRAHEGLFFWDLLDFVSVCLISLFSPARRRLYLYAEGVRRVYRRRSGHMACGRRPRRAARICILGCLFSVSRSPAGASCCCSDSLKAVNREPLCLDFKANVFDVSASFFFVPSCALLTSLSAVASNYWLLIVSPSA